MMRLFQFGCKGRLFLLFSTYREIFSREYSKIESLNRKKCHPSGFSNAGKSQSFSLFLPLKISGHQ